MIMAYLKCDRDTCFARNEFGNCTPTGSIIPTSNRTEVTGAYDAE